MSAHNRLHMTPCTAGRPEAVIAVRERGRAETTRLYTLPGPVCGPESLRASDTTSTGIACSRRAYNVSAGVLWRRHISALAPHPHVENCGPGPGGAGILRARKTHETAPLPGHYSHWRHA